jgi:hypothetical protein
MDTDEGERKMLQFLTRWASVIPTISAIGAFAGGLILTALGLILSGVIIAAFGLVLLFLLARLSNQQALAQQIAAQQANQQQGQQAQTPQQIVVAYPPDRSLGQESRNNSGHLCPTCNTPLSFRHNYCPYCGRSTLNQIAQNEAEN